MIPNWYHRAMPTIREVSEFLPEIGKQVYAIQGVQKVYVCGSAAQHLDQPTYAVKDLDIIAVTSFDSGDLMAIDDGPDSPLKMSQTALEDYGFSPEVVSFTKKFTRINGYNIDHWATSADGKLFHWGLMPDNLEEWNQSHSNAEKYAAQSTGFTRHKLPKNKDETRMQWYEAYHHFLKQEMHIRRSNGGWCPSDHPASSILEQAKKLAG